MGRQEQGGLTSRLVWPSREFLPGYVAALQRGWSPDNLRGSLAAEEELARIAEDADAFIASLVDKEAAGGPVTLPDGTTAPRLPGYRRWIWDGEFCGSIGFRWQRGTEELPSYSLGHIGYGVVPWKQGRGYATQALRDMLREAEAEGLRFVDITTDPDNVPSRRVVEANGGVLVEEFVTLPALGGTRKVRYRIHARRAIPRWTADLRPMTSSEGTMKRTRAGRTKFEHAHPILSVADMQQSLRYYVDALGFSNAEWGSDEFTCVSRDGANIYLCQGGQGNPVTWVWLGVEDVEALYDEYKASGARILHPPEALPWAREMKVEDPDGHVLRFGSDPKAD